jgi:uncharacterized protein YndB with AHSA1/START domain
MTATTNANEIRTIRVYDAPVDLVWKAWTELDQLAQWWGPRGFTITTHTRQLRPGGSWEFTMHGPDGVDYPNFVRYHEVVPHARLAYGHGASSDAAPMFQVTATFRDLGGTTELDMRMTLPTAEAAQKTRLMIKAHSGYSTWDRLAEHLEKVESSQEIFVINRSFDAPIETVFDMWTIPEHIVAWLPPSGFRMTFSHADIRVGGDALFSMSNGDMSLHARHVYQRLQRPERLVYAQTFTDAAGIVSRHPGMPTWPETTLVTVSFAAEGASQTRVTVRFELVGAVTAEERASFVDERAGMTQGWSGSFDALDGLLPAERASATMTA